MPKTPVYFLSHGGPSLIYDHDHPAYLKIQEIGKEITQRIKPKAIVVFSAHWQASPDTIQVNTSISEPLIYDFYGFPAHYYSHSYPNTGSPSLAAHILTLLSDAGIRAQGVKRGLDHGVFVPFSVAFDPRTNPLDVPVVQVSLFDGEDADRHYRLGRAIETLRDEGVVVIGSGMAVHNLRDFRMVGGRADPTGYAVSFDEGLKEAVERKIEDRQEAMAQLLLRPDARKAHPTFEHLLPIHVAAGAAGEDMGERLWTLPQGSMSWAQYRFGHVDDLAENNAAAT